MKKARLPEFKDYKPDSGAPPTTDQNASRCRGKQFRVRINIVQHIDIRDCGNSQSHALRLCYIASKTACVHDLPGKAIITRYLTPGDLHKMGLGVFLYRDRNTL